MIDNYYPAIAGTSRDYPLNPTPFDDSLVVKINSHQLLDISGSEGHCVASISVVPDADQISPTLINLTEGSVIGKKYILI